MPTSAGGVYVDVKANTRPFERSLSGLGGIASKIGSVISRALAGAAIVGFGKQCIDLASDLNEVQNVVDVTFPHMAQQVNEFAQGAADAFGLGEVVGHGIHLRSDIGFAGRCAPRKFRITVPSAPPPGRSFASFRRPSA